MRDLTLPKMMVLYGTSARLYIINNYSSLRKKNYINLGAGMGFDYALTDFQQFLVCFVNTVHENILRQVMTLCFFYIEVF